MEIRGIEMNKLFETGCGDHSCVIAKPEGMGTNDRCRCPEWKLQAYINWLVYENKELKILLEKKDDI